VTEGPGWLRYATETSPLDQLVLSVTTWELVCTLWATKALAGGGLRIFSVHLKPAKRQFSSAR